MTFTDIVSIVSLAGSGLSLCGFAYVVGVKLATLEVKVNTMWEFTLRRGRAEAVQGGFATMNSPFHINPYVVEQITPIIGPMREFYSGIGKQLNDIELAVEIERKFGDAVLDKACLPLGFHLGACMVIIIQMLREGQAVLQ